MSPDVEPAFLARVRLRVRRHVLWLEQQWANAPGALGLAISADEVHRILDGTSAEAEMQFHESDPMARALAEPIREADQAFTSDPLWTRMRHVLALSDVELDLLSLAVAIEADPWLRRAFGFIHDDATCVQPTPWLARQVFGWTLGTHLGPDANLVRWRLAYPVEGQPHPWSVTAAWVADPTIAAALLSGALNVSGVGMVEVVPPVRPAQDLCLYPDALATTVAFVRALEDSPLAAAAIELAIVGPTGAGKRTLAMQLCAQLELPLFVVNANVGTGAPSDSPVTRDAWIRIARDARLFGAAVYWPELEGPAPDLRGVPPPALAIYGATGPVTRASAPSVMRRTLRLSPITQATRVALWTNLTTLPPPAPVLDWPLWPADVVRAATMAPAGNEAVTEACRATVQIDSTSLATPLARPYEWDDLVLSSSVRRHLEELETQARLRWPVYEEWGFGRFFPMGRGIAALFAGPSGTGKTMAAQVLARSLGMELYRVDLASVMSKYIGETEKHLRKVFDACERANVLLFFDEADALFGQRTQVKDAHDRFANIEIDYLLQRIEQFDGLAVLATNRKNEIDTAFLRRVRFIIDFLPPSVAERNELWQRALPRRAPNGDDLLEGIDHGVLAENLTMTGADIKNAAVGAAFLARADGSKIAMRHVVRAARRELAKHGIVLRGGLE